MNNNSPDQDTTPPDQPVEKAQGDQYDLQGAVGAVIKPTGPVEQVFGDKIIVTEEAAVDVRGLPNPYLGLSSFTYQDRRAYAGREALIRQAVERITSPGQPQGLTFITGASGSGKSSFAQAGLLPALEVHYQARGKSTRRAVFRPSSNPLAMLADALLQLGLPDVSGDTISSFSPADLGRFLGEHTPPDQINLLVIDQFEQLFTLSPKAQAGQVYAFLDGWPGFRAGHTHVIATLRSDYLPDLFTCQPLWEIAKQGVELRAMSQAELQAAILGPLEARGREDEHYRQVRFEPALLAQLAEDAAGDAAYLPLLQVTLEDLWKRGSLTLGQYQGLGDAIQQRAELVYAFTENDFSQPDQERSPDDRAEILHIFLDLVDVSPDDDPRRDVRKSRSKEDLARGAGAGERLIDDLVRARLLRAGDEQAGERSAVQVDIIHDALLTRWDRLRTAVAERRESLKRRGRFEQALYAWLGHARSEEYLLTGVHLAEARELAETGDIALSNENSQKFLEKSVAQAEAIQRRELERERKRVRVARVFTFVLAIALAIALLAAGAAVWQTNQLSLEKSTSEARRIAANNARSTAEWQANQLSIEKSTSEARRMAAENSRGTAVAEQHYSRSRELAIIARNQIEIDPERAVLIALEATNSAGTLEAEEVLRASMRASRLRAELPRIGQELSNAQFSPDGSLVMITSPDDGVRLWDVASGEEWTVQCGEEHVVTSAQFSPDGELMVMACSDATAQLVDITSGEVRAVLKGHEGLITSTQFSRDGNLVVTAGEDSTARLWDVASGEGRAVLSGHESVVNSAQFSRDGGLVVTASDDSTARLWDVASGKVLAVLSGHEEDFGVSSAKFSPDGRMVVTAGWDGTVRLWDIPIGKPRAVLRGSEQDFGISTAEFSPDGSLLVTAGGIGTALWNVTTGEKQAVLSGQNGGVSSAQFSPDGGLVVTACGDGTARLWDVASGQELVVLRGHENSVYSAQFSPDGMLVITTGWDGTARLWDVAWGEERIVMFGQEGWVASAQFSPDGSLVVTANEDSTVRLRDVASGEERAVLHAQIGTVAGPNGLIEGGVNDAQFSPDASLVVIACTDGTAWLWDVASGKVINILRGHEFWVNSAQFSLDGSLIVTAGGDGTARLWDVASGETRVVLRGHRGGVRSAQFSPDGSLVVTASADGTVRLWDVASGGERAVLRGHQGPVISAQFSPDGGLVVTASADGTARLWDVASGEARSILRGHEMGVNSAQFSPDGSLVVIASGDGTARLWDVASGRLYAILRGHRGSVNDAQFSPDGRFIVTAGADGTARIFLVRLEDLVSLARQRVTRELTCEERVQYLHENLDCVQP